jgi:hypothetical protein
MKQALNLEKIPQSNDFISKTPTSEKIINEKRCIFPQNQRDIYFYSRSEFDSKFKRRSLKKQNF